MRRGIRDCYLCGHTSTSNEEYNLHYKSEHPDDWRWFEDLDDCLICHRTMLAADVSAHMNIHHKHWERVPDSEEVADLDKMTRVTETNYALLGLTAGLLVGAFITDCLRNK